MCGTESDLKNCTIISNFNASAKMSTSGHRKNITLLILKGSNLTCDMSFLNRFLLTDV